MNTMSFFVRIFLKQTGRILLAVVRILRRVFCCRRKRRESGMLLPLTVSYSSPVNQTSDFHDWNSWGENDPTSSPPSGEATIDKDYRVPGDGEISNPQQNSVNSNPDEEDFFKDMIPQFRKPKKLIVKELQEESEIPSHSSRLAMDPRAFPVSERELGLIEDNPSEWGEVESPDEIWDTDSLIKEKKRADREKRIAEHQKRKLEKENNRLYKSTSPPAKVNVVYACETNDRTKYS